MRSTNSTKEAIKKMFHVSASPETRARIWRQVLFVQEQSDKAKSVFVQPNIWRTIMKSPITKLTATTVILITVVFLMTFLDKAAIPLYALEQTIQANHTIKTIHLRMFKDVESIENDEFLDYWIKYDNAGKLSNLRCNEHDDDGVRFTVWNDGVQKTWIPENNVVIIIRESNTEKEFEDFAKEFDPKLTFQRLYDMSMEEEEIELNVNNPAEDSNSIYVKATHSGCKERVDLVVDRQTKLMKKFSKYCLKDQEYKLDMQIEFLAYNKPVDMSVFQLSGIPDDALVYDQVDQLVGLKKGDLTNEEIAARVVREALKATIAKDYKEVSRLMEGDPGNTIEAFIEEEFEAGLVRIISIGQPEPHGEFKHVLCVPCEIEVENEERGRWIVNIIATAKPIGYQPGNRWIMHTDLLVDESHMSSESALNAQDRIEGNLIVLGVGIGEFTLGMSKDEVLRRLGEPKGIFYGGERYTLENLPRRYYMFFGDISFRIEDDTVTEITALNPLFKFTNGLGVGDSEQEIKQAFGIDFQLEEYEHIDFLNYEDKGLHFEIRKKDRTIMEIGIHRAAGSHSDSDTPQSDKAIMLSEQPPGPVTFPKIDRKPRPGVVRLEELETIPKYNPDSRNPFQMDLRCKNLSKLDLRNSINDLMYATFDYRTVWPTSEKMPSDFDWRKIMELGKNPGLRVRSLHKKGITGRGVSIAILDQPLLVDHQEYAERLRLYEEIHIQKGTEPQMHGPAVASIAVGKTVGVAPEAELYYIAQWNFDWEKECTPTLRYLAKGIHRIIEINEQLPKDKKIRVISISKGWTRSHKEYKLITEAAQKALDAGMLVVCTSVELVHEGCDFGGLGRSPLADPDVFESYGPGLFLVRAFSTFPDGCIWVPMDSRTTAGSNGSDEYVFFRQGGFSWAVPYIAGVYALAVQVEPEITPEKFWSLAMQTGRTIELDYNGKKIPFGPIIDPVGLIRSISGDVELSQQVPSKHIIVPGVRVGDYTIGMSKDEVLEELGEPEAIHLGEDEDEVVRRGEEKYNLNNLPGEYIMFFGDIYFWIEDDTVTGITVRSPLYKLSNGLRVGDSEQKVKQAFGEDFRLEEALGKDFHCYHAKGLAFEIYKKNHTVAEIVVYKPEGDRGGRDAPEQQVHPKHTIVPGLRVGDYTFDMSKDEVLRKLGEPKEIFYGGERYTLENLPRHYYMSFGDVAFRIEDDSVKEITVASPSYKFTNGLGVGDSEQKIKKAFGDNFHYMGADFLAYEDKGLTFEINNEDRTVKEINVSQITSDNGDSDALDQEEHSKHTIIPGLRVGDYTIGMSKDEVLRKLGEPDSIFLGGERYTLDNLPKMYFMTFGDISFYIDDDTVTGIGVHSSLYKFTNGLGVGDSEEEIKQTFGDNFHLKEGRGRDFLTYEDKGLHFEIDTIDRMVMEIGIYKPTGGHSDSDTPDSRSDIPDSRKVIMLSEQPPGPITFPKIDRRPKPLGLGGGFGRGEIKSLPKYDPNSTEPFQVDLRGSDLSRLDLRNSIDNLMYATFDDDTVWPKSVHVPEEFDTKKIMKLGENPGLGVRTLHKMCITGKGVGVAIIDQPLLTEHQEYADRLRLYEENNVKESDVISRMHGAAVASIAVGKTLGVAPDADLYYIATWNTDYTRGDDPPQNFIYKAQSIRRLLEINRWLPADRKIRVISMSVGWSPSQDGYEEIMAACEEAKAAGIFLISCSIERVHGFKFHGLGRHPFADPDVFESYEPGLWWAKGFYDGRLRGSDRLLVPMDSRTTASPCGGDEYVFYRQGGWSWSVPYIAGVYALAAQVEPDITPERFWSLAMKTGRTVELDYNGKKVPFGPIVDPVRLIRSTSDDVELSQRAPSKHTIVPGERVGDYTFDMSKDEVLRKLGEPDSIQLEEDEVIHHGDPKYSLNNLPRVCILVFGDVSFWLKDNSVIAISVRSPLYKLSNGLKVGDSEQKIKQAFGKDFYFDKTFGKDYLCYDAKWLAFGIHEKNRTVTEIATCKPEGDRDAPDQQDKSKHTIVPGLRVGEYTIGMGKEEVIKKLGEPGSIRFEGQRYTLDNLPDNLPRRYIMSFSDFSFGIEDDIVTGVTVRSPLYKFANGLGVGNTEEEIKRAFGNDFQLGEYGSKNLINYEGEGIQFEIRNRDKTVVEIDVYPAKRDHEEGKNDTSDINRKIAQICTGPADFNDVIKIFGQPSEYRWRRQSFELEDLPVERYWIMYTDSINIFMKWDKVDSLEIIDPAYVFNGKIPMDSSLERVLSIVGQPKETVLGERGWEDCVLYKDINGRVGWCQYRREDLNAYFSFLDNALKCVRILEIKSREEGENDTTDINQKIAQICSGPTDFNDVIRIFGKPSDYKWSGQSFKLEDLPVERYWIWYPDSIHVFMRWDKVDMLEIVDSAYVFNGKIPMGSSLESVLSIVGQPKETVVGQQGWEDGVLYKDINGRVGWCQYRREDLNADFRFLNYTLKCVHILEINSSSATAGRAAKRGDFKTVKTIRSVNEFENVRSKDLSELDFSSRKGLIATLQFNQETVWPEQAKMPPGCDPQKILTDAMNPGLGVRGLHRQGITGKGVNVAIIDQPLLPDHPEYNGKIVAYHDTGCGPYKSSMHGPAVASLLVGTNCGTAPDARIYYAAAPSWKRDTAYEAKALDWIIEQNKKLPVGQKIRVVSVSAAPSSPNVRDKNREMWDEACARAEADGIMVLDCTDSHRGFINRGWYNPGDPESVIKFNFGPPPKREFRVDPTEMSIYVPSSCRTTAQHYDDYNGRNSYIYWGRGGLSWSIPYCAGVLAMGWQIHPDMTPAQMKEMLFASAYVHKSGARIINPRGFIEALKRLR